MEPLPIFDAHVHLWDPTHLPMPWLDALPALRRPCGTDAFGATTATLPITGFIAVEAAVAPTAALREAQWLAALAREEPRLRGIVAAAPLEAGTAVRAHLDALRTISPGIIGVRRNIQDEADPAFCLQPDFVRGTQLLAEFDLTCDLCVRQEQLPAITALVRQCPHVRFILDHLGKPPIKDGQLDPWRANLATLAAHPNVACKVSGLVTEANHQQWQTADLALYVAHALAVFGPERVLFGSDWPVLTLASSYADWVATLTTLTAHLALDQQQALWAGNAQRWYRLSR